MAMFEETKTILLFTVDAVINAAQASQPGLSHGHPPSQRTPTHSSIPSSSTSSQPGPFSLAKSLSSRPRSSLLPSPSSSLPPDSSQGLVKRSGLDEHRKLFVYQPSKSWTNRGSRGKNSRKRQVVKMWKKECICLKYSEQEIKPSSEEKIKLAKIGLGLHELVFEANGNAEHVHNTILDKFPVLEYCGGYSLLRLASNSHNFIEINSPEGGTMVPFFTRCSESSQTIHPTTPAHYR